jgi:hypothetical protein
MIDERDPFGFGFVSPIQIGTPLNPIGPAMIATVLVPIGRDLGRISEPHGTAEGPGGRIRPGTGGRPDRHARPGPRPGDHESGRCHAQPYVDVRMLVANRALTVAQTGTP